jgi:hypothetical protein
MRYSLLLVALLACGKDSTGPDVTGTVFFRMDPPSCTYTGTVTFLIENQEVGTYAIAAGGTSNGYETPATSTFTIPGRPVVQAMVRGYTNSYLTTPVTLWTYRTNVLVPDRGTVTHTFTC